MHFQVGVFFRLSEFDVTLFVLGFDCSSPRICCGTKINRYCCVPPAMLTSSSSSSSPSPILYEDFDDADPYTMRTSSTLLNDKWLLLQMCTVGIFVAILLLLIVIVYLYFTTMRHGKLKGACPSFSYRCLQSHQSARNQYAWDPNALPPSVAVDRATQSLAVRKHR